MTMDARERARQNLRQRIQRFLRDSEGGVITRWQAGMVRLAIEQLRGGDFEKAERTVMKAERPDMWQWSTPIELTPPLRLVDLVRSLEEALKAD
jgi:hypothetical protein